MSEPVPRVVLDTNVCLDLFLFDDPHVAHLRRALQAGAVISVTDDACRDEWLRVLAYPQLALTPAQRETAVAAFDAVMKVVAAITTSLQDISCLPRCRDPDDQKFLELALRAHACWLLSRDDHLLSLSRRTQRDGLFDILTPQAWAAAPEL